MADYTSPFKTGIQFLDRIGVYEVLLPFLLVFTLVFAILEKSKLFGTETINDVEMTKKNLNSMFAFVVSFFVVASTRLVATINEAMANMTILLLLGISFLILVGVFHTGKDELELEDNFKNIFTWLMFAGILIIFLHAIKTKNGTPWLYYAWGFLLNNYTNAAFGAAVLTLLIVLLMGYITKTPEEKSSAKEEEH
jgi:hypothetical protein